VRSVGSLAGHPNVSLAIGAHGAPYRYVFSWTQEVFLSMQNLFFSSSGKTSSFSNILEKKSFCSRFFGFKNMNNKTKLSSHGSS
jgi:hypothetical protein